MGNWKANRWAFTELVRTLGQMSAANAAVAGSAEIRWSDIPKSFAAGDDDLPVLRGRREAANTAFLT